VRTLILRLQSIVLQDETILPGWGNNPFCATGCSDLP
jgi:hypothetical protein